MRCARGSLAAMSPPIWVGTTPATVLPRTPRRRSIEEGRRYRVTPSDRSYQRMSVLSTEGFRTSIPGVLGSRRWSAGHWNAIGRFAATGDVAVLAPFKGKRVGGSRAGHRPRPDRGVPEDKGSWISMTSTSDRQSNHEAGPDPDRNATRTRRKRQARRLPPDAACALCGETEARAVLDSRRCKRSLLEGHHVRRTGE